MIDLDSIIHVAPDQVSSDFPDGIAILSLQSGGYYGLDGAGCRVWNLVQHPITVRELKERTRRRV